MTTCVRACRCLAASERTSASDLLDVRVDARVVRLAEPADEPRPAGSRAETLQQDLEPAAAQPGRHVRQGLDGGEHGSILLAQGSPVGMRVPFVSRGSRLRRSRSPVARAAGRSTASTSASADPITRTCVVARVTAV